ncbi:MAG: DUF1697 domain-containing protein [Pseudomonadota bacterium]
MSTCHIALLRGINVGTAKRVAMAELRILVAELGYTEVRTLLNSGNVVFHGKVKSAPAAAAEIEAALLARTGVAARVMLLQRDELDAIVAACPLGDKPDGARVLIYLLRPGYARAPLASLAAGSWGEEVLVLGERAAYLWCPDGALESRAAAALGKLLGDTTTARNWNTLCKLQALAHAR